MTGMKYCMGCMQQLSWDGRCRFCDFKRDDYKQEEYHLPLYSTLKNGEYLIGRVLGEGGFGITYIGLDTTLLQRVAIKEFYPKHLGKRREQYGSCAVTVRQENQKDTFEQGMDSFLREGRTLAKFSRLDAVAGVKTFFRENGTAYLVMEYIDGMSVKEYVQTFGAMKPEAVLSMIRPIIRDLQHIHEEHIFHRDVSADNLIIDANGKLTLIDFGSARQILSKEERTNTILYKPGYSALEQYSASGKQGAWTDVYGLCASVYYMLTGIVPESAMERIAGDQVQSLCDMESITLAANIKETLWRGMAVEQKDRCQSMSELYQALYDKPISDALPMGIPKSTFLQRNISYSVREKVLSHTRMQRELIEAARKRERKIHRKQWIIGLTGITLLICGFLIWQLFHDRISAGFSQRHIALDSVESSESPTGKSDGPGVLSEIIPTASMETNQMDSQKADKAASMENHQTAVPEVKQTASPKADYTAKPKTKKASKSKAKRPVTSKKKSTVEPKARQTAKPTVPPMRIQEDDHVAGDLHSLE